MTKDDRFYLHRVALFAHAQRVGVTQACRDFQVHRSSVNGQQDLPVDGRLASRSADTRIPGRRTATPSRDQASGTTPLPSVASARRSDGPSVTTRWAWCNSRSTVAVASVLGMMVSKPAGCRLLVTARLRFS